MDIHEIRLANLRELADRAGGRPALSRMLEMSYPLLQNYIGKTPTKRIGDKTARKAEEVFSLPYGWMDSVDDVVAAPVTRASEDPRPGYVRLRTFDATPYMGMAGTPVDFPEVLGYVDVLRDYLAMELRTNPDNLDLLPVKGDSMSGTIEHGDIVFVDRTVRNFDGDGVYVIVWNEGLMVKRLQGNGRGGLRIKSDNAKYDPIEVAPDEIEQLTICGRVTGSWAVRRI